MHFREGIRPTLLKRRAVYNNMWVPKWLPLIHPENDLKIKMKTTPTMETVDG